ncbi:MAG: dNTP triphosphohydrolase [Ignavibacteria bacterium]|nr:dNTP triphosphohydrolase [Ignavibacteria bacterium]
MNWEQLLNAKRFGRENLPETTFDGRSEFQKDFDRIVFSTAFRRLQNKTQVVPLPETDFVHTRLTHSIESSCVGRSLGHLVGKRILNENPNLKFSEYDFEAVVAAACLAHDIGNPPFGHTGEDAISEYFKSERAQKFIKDLNELQINDLQNFEGNAAGFRLLTYTFPSLSNYVGGLGLTYSTLGVFTKYPKSSLPVRKNSGNASEKKYGYFESDISSFDLIANALGLKKKEFSNGYYRHPLSFLVEAADDICYRIVDLEDGYKLRFVEFNKVKTLLEALILTRKDENLDRLSNIYDENEQIAYLRSRAIGILIKEAADIFMDNAKDIMIANFDIPLLKKIKALNILSEIEELSVNNIYQSKPVLEIEAAGFEVLSGLLDAFLNALFQTESKYYKTIRKLIPKEYLLDESASAYLRIITITLYVSSMTDTYAIEIFKKIRGISLARL